MPDAAHFAMKTLSQDTSSGVRGYGSVFDTSTAATVTGYRTTDIVVREITMANRVDAHTWPELQVLISQILAAARVWGFAPMIHLGILPAGLNGFTRGSFRWHWRT